ncbi:MAG: metallophosphoesterase [Acidobacteriota bacterium]|nr:MAG: metallophosphoesterase [Acidobacteriota bacterium]
MKRTALKRVKLRDRINAYVAAEKPLRLLADNWTKKAREAIEEANSLSLERVNIELKRLPRKLDGFRIIHLSDIHHSPFTGVEHIERVVKITNRLHPDLIVLTGDYVSHHTEYVAPVAELLGQLKAPHGVHACLGNHDHWTDAELVTRSFRDEGINLLVNEGFRLEVEGGAFWLAGVDDHMVGKTDVKASLLGSFPDEMKMLLAHNPIIFREAARYGVDLTLSGHTHGGQIRVRDAEKGIIPRRRKAGLHRNRGSQLYITRGIGTVVVPVRYQCPPEISLLELKTAK